MRRQSERGRNSSSKRTGKRWTGFPDPSTSDSPHGTKGLRPARTLARAGEVRGIPKYPKACAIALFRPSSSSPGPFAQGRLIRQCGTQHGQPSHAINQTLPCNPDPSIAFSAGLCRSTFHSVASSRFVSAPRDSFILLMSWTTTFVTSSSSWAFSASTNRQLPCLRT